MWTFAAARSTSRSGVENTFASSLLLSFLPEKKPKTDFTFFSNSNPEASRTGRGYRQSLYLPRRTFATGVSSSDTIEAPADLSPSALLSPPPRELSYPLFASLILARAPLLTKAPTSFEGAYYAYQARIQRTLSSPFPSEFYFKKGTLLERRFLAEERVREQAAFGEGFEGEEGAEKLEDVPSDEDEVKLLPREHEADRIGDVKNLNRQGERNLYLLVKSKDENSWHFPLWSAGLEQPLHKVRILLSCRFVAPIKTLLKLTSLSLFLLFCLGVPRTCKRVSFRV